MQGDIDFISLMFNATFIVQLVMFVLIAASIMSWTFIVNKWFELRKAKRVMVDFEGRFWSGADLGQLHNELSEQERNFGVTAIFNTGFVEYARLHKQGDISVENISATVVRAMKVACSRESEKHESHLNFLATVGSTSPYIGLLGTVWGIMHAFLALSDMQQATLALVAPGFGEALIATAMGLFAAIPAVIAYNRFLNQTERLMTHYDNFIEEFTAILNRQTPHS